MHNLFQQYPAIKSNNKSLFQFLYLKHTYKNVLFKLGQYEGFHMSYK